MLPVMGTTFRAAFLVALLLSFSLAQAQVAPVPDHFYTWAEITSQIEKWKKEHPALVHVETIGQTFEGRDIPILKISDNADRDEPDEPQILIQSGIHPREQQPQIATMRLITELLDRYGHDETITRLVDTRQIWIIPVLNVDGKVYDMRVPHAKPANCRKNRAKSPNGSAGVDLNRNFAHRWGGAGKKPFGGTYQGAAPMSEPETRALAGFLESHPIRVFVDTHSHMKAIYLPKYFVKSEREIFDRLMSGMFATQKSRYRTYSELPAAGADPPDVRRGSTGLTFNWSYYATGAYGFNIEIGGSGFYDAPSKAFQEYTDNVRGPLLYLIDHCAELPLRKPGSAKFVPDPPNLSLSPGATVHWVPAITGPCDYAVLMSQSPLIEITSEYRTVPIQTGFTIKVEMSAKPGTSVPAKLYLWTSDHARTVVDVTLTITRP